MNIKANYNKKKLEEFLQTHSKCHFMQSFEWTKVKDNWQHEFIVVEDKNKKKLQKKQGTVVRSLNFHKN